MNWIPVMRHGWRLLVAGSLLGLVAGLALGLWTRPTYEGRVEVLVRPILADPFQATTTAGRVVNMYTERQRAGSSVVAGKAQPHLHPAEDVRTLRSRLTVTVTGSTQLLEFAFRDGDADRARDGALAFAQAYLEDREETATRQNNDRRARLEAALAPLDAAIAEAQTALGLAPARSSEAAAAKALLRDLTTQAQPYRQGLSSVLSVDLAGGGVVVSDGGTPARGGGLPPAAIAGTGLVLGLLAAALAAVLGPGRRQRLWTRADVESPLGAPVLSTLPAAGPGGARARDAALLLRTRLMLMAERHGHRCILVVAPTHHSPSGTVVTMLATGLDRAGRRVVVVSSDSARSHALASFLGDQREGADLVIVDAAPALESSDFVAFVHSGMVDGVVVVADSRHTRADQLVETRRQLEGSGVPVMGAVMLRGGGRARPELSQALPIRVDTCPVPSP
jgi:capsular polysaccharide biosynthesis protein